MKQTLLLLLSGFLFLQADAQYVYTIKADSVKITNCDSAELIIENHTQGIPGFLFNTGNGRTIFKRAVMQLDDSTYVVGADTIHTNRPSYWKANGTHIYNTNPGNVGIRRQNPNVLLDLPGPVNIDDTSSYRIHYHPVVRLTGWVDTARTEIVFGPVGAYANLLIGDSSGLNSAGLFSTFIGNQAGVNSSGDGNTMVGYASGYNNGGLGNTLVGTFAGYNNSSDGTFVGNAEWNAYIGYSAGGQSSGQENAFVGADAGTNNSGSLNAFLGDQSGAGSGGSSNSFFGSYCGWSNTGDNNSFLGSGAGMFNIGPNNILHGYNAGQNNQGSSNMLSGYFSGSNNIGSANCLLGDSAGVNNQGNNNVALGLYAGMNNEGDNNVLIGANAGYINTSQGGAGNTIVGANAGTSTYANSLTLIGNNTSAILGLPNGDPVQNATALGANATVNASNTMAFGDATVSSWLLGLSTPVSGRALIVGSNSSNGNGAYLTTGGVWTNASDRNKKENFRTLDDNEILAKINQLPVTRWNYKGLAEQHIGPVAQDFHRIFDVGSDDKTISTIDPSGIALAGIQSLYHKWQYAKTMVTAQAAQIRDLQSEIQLLKAKLEKQEDVTRMILEKLNSLQTASH